MFTKLNVQMISRKPVIQPEGENQTDDVEVESSVYLSFYNKTNNNNCAETL